MEGAGDIPDIDDDPPTTIDRVNHVLECWTESVRHGGTGWSGPSSAIRWLGGIAVDERRVHFICARVIHTMSPVHRGAISSPSGIITPTGN